MSIQYKIDIMDALKAKGYTSYLLAKEKVFGQATLTKFRNQGQLNFNDLNKLCRLLECQPCDILEYIPDEEKVEVSEKNRSKEV